MLISPGEKWTMSHFNFGIEEPDFLLFKRTGHSAEWEELRYDWFIEWLTESSWEWISLVSSLSLIENVKLLSPASSQKAVFNKYSKMKMWSHNEPFNIFCLMLFSSIEASEKLWSCYKDSQLSKNWVVGKLRGEISATQHVQHAVKPIFPSLVFC